MNLQDITAKAWILALFIRDDGERFLLGDGWYDFKDSLQHFQPDNIANDVVELQGADGQLLAGQVRRSGTQEFDGYVGDATTPKAIIETRRRDFLGFFKARSRYKVVYIFPDGTAIQRQRGYLVEPPTVQEMWQFFPEYHVALSFENVPYYEYDEDSSGHEKYANIVTLTALYPSVVGYYEARYLTNVTYSYPKVIDTRIVGNISQSSTPTPNAPVPVRAATGLQDFVSAGRRNLLKPYFGYTHTSNGITFSWDVSRILTMSGIATGDAYFKTSIQLKNCEATLPAGDYVFSVNNVPSGCRFTLRDKTGTSLASDIQGAFTLSTITQLGVQIRVASGTDLSNGAECRLQIVRGTTSIPYSNFLGQYYDVNLGKNLFDGVFEQGTINSSTGANASDTSRIRSKNYITVDENTSYTISSPDYSGDWLWYEYKSDKSYNLSSSKSGETITTQSGTRYVRVRPDSTGLATTIRAQVEAGGVASSYADYFEPIELYSTIGNQVDFIYKSGSTWTLHKEIHRLNLDGTSEGTWVAASGYSNLFYNDSFAVRPNKVDNTPICSHFNGVPLVSGIAAASQIPDNSICFLDTTSQSTYRCYLKSSSFSTVAQLTSWLASHSVSLFYRRDSALVTAITDSALLAQLNRIQSTLSLYAPDTTVFTTSKGDNIPMRFRIEYMAAANEQSLMATGGGALPVWTVRGPVANPSLKNATTDETLTYNNTLGANDVLVVDMSERTATLNGATNVIADMVGSWVELTAGENMISYVNDGQSGTSTIEWNGVVG